MLSHVDAQNQPKMVNISDKKVTKRIAHAQSIVIVPPPVLELLEGDEIRSKKGPVFQTAQVAGIMAAKKTGELIPLCHPIGLEDCVITITINDQKEIVIDCIATVNHKTGVEMEALTGASVAALTVYDMCKAVSHDITIKNTRLIKKTGGKSDYVQK